MALVVGIAVTLGCFLLGTLLMGIELSLAAAVGAFFRQFASTIGFLAALWFFVKNWV